jgi:hypothetical protein
MIKRAGEQLVNKVTEKLFDSLQHTARKLRNTQAEAQQ